MSHDLSENEKYRLLLNAITDYAIYVLDAEGRVSSWNPGAERFKGYQAPEILGEHFSRFYTDEDRAAGLPQRNLAIVANEGRFEGEGWRIRKDGGRFWAHVVIDPIRSPEGKVIGYAKITRDLTEKKKADETLHHSREQFRLLVQGVTDYAIFMLDPTGRVSSWNAGAERIKGYRPDEIIGEHFSRFYTEEDRQAGLPQRALEQASREGRFVNEGWRVRKDGSRFFSSVVVEPIRDEGGELVGFAKITRDITERREAQHALAEAQEQLLQSRKLEALGQLAGGVAHDFNNLLMAISGSLELLRKRVPDDPKITSLLDNALQGAQRGTSLTQRLLTFSRRQPLHPRSVDLPHLIRELRDLIQLSIGGSIAIDIRSPQRVSAVHVDPNQLELALLNIAANARDAMPDGGTLTITTSEEVLTSGEDPKLPAGRYVRLSVVDTGEGMDDETLARSTEPFFTTKGPGKGTGLGLSMVHGLVEDFSGRLILKSRRGEGTTVEIWLPAYRGAANASSTEPVDAPTMDDTQTPLRVLAVDDDTLVLMNTVAMLEDLGHLPSEAVSGAAALRAIQGQDFDLVITDQGMPGMTGLQLAQALRETRPHLPIVIATGYPDLPDHTVKGPLMTLNKPFGMEQLQAVIADAVAS